MTSLAKHWAAPYIGRPWSPNGEGPDTFSCWGWVRFAFRLRHGIVMPSVPVGELAPGVNVGAIKQAAQASGWRPVEGKPEADDIVLMWGPDGRHVGLMVETDKGLMLVHSTGYMTTKGPVGSVIAQPLADALRDGYGEVELWRRA